jgi:hypothetical protein
MKRTTKKPAKPPTAADKKKLETVQVLADAHLDQVNGGRASPCCCGVCK